MTRAEVVLTCTASLWLCAAVVSGCARRTLDPQGPGSLGLDAGGGNGAGAGSGAGGGAGGAVGGRDASVDRLGHDMLLIGQACASSAECASGFCADGVCCNAACTGDCVRCDMPGFVGTCATIAAGAPPKTPGACPVEIVQTCGTDGTCDGAGNCRLQPLLTPCGSGRCDGDAIVGAMVCDGRGHCRTGPMTICVPFHCDPATNQCRLRCATDADCASPAKCLNGGCRTPSIIPCARNADCASGTCSGGVCCNVACDGPCLTCNLPGREGTCWPQPSGTDCGSQPTCLNGIASGIKRCDTAGHCDDWGPETCAPFTCNPATNLCRYTCASDGDCAPPSACVANSCGRRESRTCDSGGDCDSGFCSRGVCCDRRCDDPCHSCSVPGSVGTCVPIADDCGPPDAGLP
jgi:hypothetical protein